MSKSKRLTEKNVQSLEYIQSMLGQLRTMAQAERADMVAYLIEMAYTETSDVLRGQRPLELAPPTAGRNSDGDMKKRDSAA
jgi:hypothetical protein